MKQTNNICTMPIKLTSCTNRKRIIHVIHTGNIFVRNKQIIYEQYQSNLHAEPIEKRIIIHTGNIFVRNKHYMNNVN